MVSKRPNFLIIVADDLGFSDLGSFGGEIQTPNLDALATAGLRLTNFHTASMCSPTRAMLLSGTDHHIAGLGQMAHWGKGLDLPVPWKDLPGYEGYLNFRVAALPEILQDAGYFTCMSGKWHLGMATGLTPHERGFERSFALLPGAAPHYAFEPKGEDGKPVFKHWSPVYRKDGEIYEVEDEEFYSSDAYATEMIRMLEDRRKNPETSEKPFFAYLPFTAPHWPLQAPQENIKRYNGVYADGPDALREQRLKRQIELGLIPKDIEPHPVDTESTEWEEMTPEEQAWSARTMEVYAGMVDRMDANIGRVVTHLKETHELENTFILFMSDNGAEGAVFEAIPMTGDVIKKSIGNHFNNDLENLGKKDSFIWYGPRWALAATAPSRGYKGFVTEGGIRCPAIIHYPLSKGGISDTFTSVMDILPTILALAQIPLPASPFRGREIVPVKGKSWTPLLLNPSARVHSEDYITGWELFFHQAIRKGSWKAVFIPKPSGDEKWQLYDLEHDRGEVHDVAGQYPDVLDELIKHWLAYVSEFGVFL